MALYNRKDVILAKLETVVGTDSVPTGAANSMLVRNLTITPMEQTLVSRDLIRQYFGNSEQLPAQLYAQIEFEVEAAGSGAAGTAPKFGPLLQACGMVETVSAGTKVEYDPTSTESATKSVSIYAFADGVRHLVTGARGTVSLAFTNQGIPVIRYRLLGKYATPTDATPTGVTYAGWTKPVIVNATNTTPFTLHGISPTTASVEIDLANNVVYRDYVGGSKQVLITNRAPAGSITMEAVLVASKNWFQTVENATTGALALTHGQTAGNIVKVDCPAVQLTNPTYQDSDGIKMLQMGMILCPSAGNDEIKLTFQ